MVEVMHDVVFHATKDVQKFEYIFVSYDELNIIDNQSWLYVQLLNNAIIKGNYIFNNIT
jgi:hypothetical protein